MAEEARAAEGDGPAWADVGVRLVIVAGLLVWSFLIVRPFISVVIWGAILGVALHPTYVRLVDKVGGRRKSAAAALVLAILALLMIPTLVLTDSLLDGVSRLNSAYEAGDLRIPAAPDGVADIPFVGSRVAEAWDLASTDFVAATEQIRPQLEAAREFIVATAADAATASLKLLFSLVVMAGLLATAPKMDRGVRQFAARVSGERGERLVTLARDTIRSVTRGILGVAVIQAVLGGLGCLVVGVPAAGLWSLLILVLCVAQLGPILILGPIAIYVFKTEPTWIAVAFLVWSIAVAMLDNILKPLLLGRGVGAPMLVVFVGAIGGMLLSGLVGLFVGPVVLVVTYTLVQSWVAPPAPQTVMADAVDEAG